VLQVLGYQKIMTNTHTHKQREREDPKDDDGDDPWRKNIQKIMQELICISVLLFYSFV
jgi:hypothetical protein